MNEKLRERLAALSELLEAIEMKAGKHGSKLDPLALARVLLFVDAATKRLAKLEETLQPLLFENQELA